MSLPEMLSGIFRSKQKSYKMVLILSLLDELSKQQASVVPLKDVKERFLAFYQKREQEGLVIEKPPVKSSNSWGQMTLAQLNLLIHTPIDALSSVLTIIDNGQSIGFRPDVLEEMRSDVIQELREYAEREIEDFYSKMTNHVPISQLLSRVLAEYLTSKSQPFAKHPLGEIVRQTIPNQLRALSFIGEQYKVQGSVGQGNWADIPWIAIMDPRITSTTQYGVYVVYLFSDDMSSVYLTLAQGVTEPLKEGKKIGYQLLRDKVQEIRGMVLLDRFQKDENIQLTTKGIGEAYQVSTVAYARYEATQLPNNEDLVADLQNMLENYEAYVEAVAEGEQTPMEEDMEEEEVQLELDHLPVSDRLAQIKGYIEQKGFSYPKLLLENFYLSLKTKPFVILAGISGTGKTKLVKLFAEAVGATGDNGQFSLIPVRPDWSDPSDLLGYKDLSGVFRLGRLTEILIEATKPENRNKPFFICLDEMNLARVEHYFSDILSILESQSWQNDRIQTDALVAQDLLNASGLGHFTRNLNIPDNVFIIGTVNMDETTHPFSKKVLDRANTIEFNYIELQDFPGMEEVTERAAAEVVPSSFIRMDYLQLQDAYGDHTDLIRNTTEKLVRINRILEEIHAHIGFRVRDAVCFYMVYNQRFGLMSKEQAFDLQLLQKILPRIQGSSQSIKRVLIELMLLCTNQRKSIEEMMNDASELYKPWRRYAEAPPAVYPQSAQKLAYMLRRLEEDGFTSFWLS